MKILFKNLRCILALFGGLQISFSQSIIHYIFEVKFPFGIKKIEGFTATYKGRDLSLNNGNCFFEEENEIASLSIIILPQYCYVAEGNNIRYVLRKKEDPCKWYQLTARCEKNDQGVFYHWDIEEKDPKKQPQRLPGNALVVFADPSCIETIKAPRISSIIDSGSHKAAYLPLLVIKQDLSEEVFMTMINHELLQTLDCKNIHRPEKPSL
jgi:hypothetical protein